MIGEGFQLVKHIKNKYYEETLYIVGKVRDDLSETKIREIAFKFKCNL